MKRATPRIACGLSSPRRQQGQSLVEMAVMSALLVPLFLLIPILGKYAHIRQAAQQAARNAAWEATVSSGYRLPDGAAVRRLAIDRHYDVAGAPIRTQPSNRQESDRVGNPLLNTFSNQPLLERRDVRMGAYRNERGGGLMNLVSGLLTRLPGEFPPNDKGLVTANFDITIQDLKLANGASATYLEPFDAIGLRMRVSHTLLTDPWNASGPGAGSNPDRRSVLAQTKSLAPASHLSGLGRMLDTLDVIPVLNTLDRLEPGYIAPDVVPHDKLERHAPRN